MGDCLKLLWWWACYATSHQLIDSHFPTQVPLNLILLRVLRTSKRPLASNFLTKIGTYCSGWRLITAGKKMGTESQESDVANTALGRKDPLGCSGRTALWREQCDVFTPCKNCNFETSSRNYATVDEVVFSPCRGELCVPCRADPRLASLVAKQQL
jgi:hypothetical protein